MRYTGINFLLSLSLSSLLFSIYHTQAHTRTHTSSRLTKLFYNTIILPLYNTVMCVYLFINLFFELFLDKKNSQFQNSLILL
jgi:hypothetical protein